MFTKTIRTTFLQNYACAKGTLASINERLIIILM